MNHEHRNMKEIERTNQRGGRCLSIIDLINARTISAETAAFCWMAIQYGGPFITGAVPGGAGKTTLMAALLGFLPPNEKIVTVKDHTVLENLRNTPSATPACLLAHEIGQGPWFAYIWGDTAQDFFGLHGPGLRPVTCLHADTPAQTQCILSSCGVAHSDIQAIRLHLYIRNFGKSQRKHRVTRIDYRANDNLYPVYSWNREQDELVRSEDQKYLANLLTQQCPLDKEAVLEQWRSYDKRLQKLQKDSIAEFRKVREKVLEAYRGGE